MRIKHSCQRIPFIRPLAAGIHFKDAQAFAERAPESGTLCQARLDKLDAGKRHQCRRSFVTLPNRTVRIAPIDKPHDFRAPIIADHGIDQTQKTLGRPDIRLTRRDGNNNAIGNLDRLFQAGQIRSSHIDEHFLISIQLFAVFQQLFAAKRNGWFESLFCPHIHDIGKSRLGVCIDCKNILLPKRQPHRQIEGNGAFPRPSLEATNNCDHCRNLLR